MNIQLFTLIFFSVSCSAIAQILLRTGMSQKSVATSIAGGDAVSAALAIALSPWVVGGLSLYFFGAVVWLFVLSRVQASFAYPFVGVGFILTLLLGTMLLGETVTAIKVAGTLVVSLGVFLIAVS